MGRTIRMWLLAGLLGISVLGLAGCSTPGSDLPQPSDLARETTETAVFYATGRSLFEERNIVDAENYYLSTLEVWLEAMPSDNPDIAIVQPEADVLSAELEDGVLTIDWSAEVLDFEGLPEEKLIALGGLLRTFGQFPEVEQVRFTVEGQVDGTIGDKDVEVFWDAVTLREQPWDVLRPSVNESEETTASS